MKGGGPFWRPSRASEAVRSEPYDLLVSWAGTPRLWLCPAACTERRPVRVVRAVTKGPDPALSKGPSESPQEARPAQRDLWDLPAAGPAGAQKLLGPATPLPGGP